MQNPAKQNCSIQNWALYHWTNCLAGYYDLEQQTTIQFRWCFPQCKPAIILYLLGYTVHDMREVVWCTYTYKCIHKIVHLLYNFVTFSFVMVISSFLVDLYDPFTHILQDCQWSNPKEYGEINQQHTTLKQNNSTNHLYTSRDILLFMTTSYLGPVSI